MIFVLSELVPSHIFFYDLAEDCFTRFKINKAFLFKHEEVRIKNACGNERK